jgi:acyl carrier protein
MTKYAPNKLRKLESREQLESLVRKVVSEQLSIELVDVTNDKSIYDDFGADSLDAIELGMAIEDELGVELPEEEMKDALSTVTEICDFLLTNRYIEVRETEHDVKMRTDTEYRNRYNLSRIPKGRIFTVSLQCVDEEASVELMATMFSKPTKLLAGCEILRIDMRDEGTLHLSLKNQMKALLEND